MTMQAKVFPTDPFVFIGQGADLVRWLRNADVQFPETVMSFTPGRGDIVGAQYSAGWIIFDGLQVIQIVPHEVDACWRYESLPATLKTTGIWEIEESEWMKTFSPRHLGDHKHFIIDFYHEETVEVICRDLIFGYGTFNLETVLATEKRLKQAYLMRAYTYERMGKFDAAIENYQRYIDCCTDDSSANYAKSRIDSIQRKRM